LRLKHEHCGELTDYLRSICWGVELQHYVMQPDPFAPEWNLKIFFAPVKPNPFK
jgi:hypothetical protein